MDLDGDVYGLLGRLRREQLGHCRSLPDGRTPRRSDGGLVDEQARRLHLRGDLGELVSDRLELLERPAERLATRRVRNRGVERGLRHADREGADAGPEEVERLHGDAKARVHLAEDLRLPDEDAVELEPADRVRREAAAVHPRRPRSRAGRRRR